MAMLRMSYDQMEEHFNRVICERLGETGGTSSLSVTPSFFETVQYGEGDDWIVEWSTEPVLRGHYRVKARLDRFWSSEGGSEYIGPELVDPTWDDLMVEAEKMIRATKDYHHCFLEGVDVASSDLEALASTGDEAVINISFVMGS